MIKITKDFINKISETAKSSPRRRTNYNFHKDYGERVQRMLNAAEPGTYIRPHKHESPDKVEVFLVLNGSAAVIEFDDNGNVTDHMILDHEKGDFAVEIPPRVWHTFVCLRTETVLYEAKEGPYSESSDKNFASWAPAEGSPDADEFNKKILKKIGVTV